MSRTNRKGGSNRRKIPDDSDRRKRKTKLDAMQQKIVKLTEEIKELKEELRQYKVKPPPVNKTTKALTQPYSNTTDEEREATRRRWSEWNKNRSKGDNNE